MWKVVKNNKQINTETLKNQINQQKLTINKFIEFLKKYRNYNIIFYSDYFDLKKFSILECSVDDDEELLDIVIDCDYSSKRKGRKSVKCSTLIKKLDEIQKQYNYDLLLNIKISEGTSTSDGNIYDIFIKDKEIKIYLALVYGTMIYD